MKKKVNLKESELVSLISKIVSGAVAEQKKQWIAENEKKNKAIIEAEIAKHKKGLVK
jgi:hypothetical protein